MRFPHRYVRKHTNRRPHPCHGGEIYQEWLTGLEDNPLYTDYDYGTIH